MTVAAAPTNPLGGPGEAGGAPPSSAGTGAAGQPRRAVPPRAGASEACPLCGAPLHPHQDWCMACGAAARTRLAATPNWKAPIATLAVVAVLALGVLAAALVKLAGGSGSTTPATTTVTTAPAASTPVAPAATTPGTPTTAPPGASTPTSGPTTSAPTTSTPTTVVPGTSAPGTSTPGATSTPTSGATQPKSSPKLTPAQQELLRRLEHPGTRK